MKAVHFLVFLCIGSTYAGDSDELNIPFEWTEWGKCEANGIRSRKRMQCIQETAFTKEGCCGNGPESAKCKHILSEW